jgi:hypothetical protein
MPMPTHTHHSQGLVSRVGGGGGGTNQPSEFARARHEWDEAVMAMVHSGQIRSDHTPTPDGGMAWVSLVEEKKTEERRPATTPPTRSGAAVLIACLYACVLVCLCVCVFVCLRV